MTYFLGGSGFIFDDKFIRGQTASNSVDASIINMFLMLSSYPGGRTRDLHLDNVTMKLVNLLCHLSSIYT